MKIAKLSGKPEIFHTIQGEGKSAGLPCIFLRLSQCNLHCIWCDTDYTWNWAGTPFEHIKDEEPGYAKFKKEDQIIECSVGELAQRIGAYACANIVITGGEPLMQQKELAELAEILRKEGQIRHIEIETNGTLMPTNDLDRHIDQYNVSPKLSNSNNSEKIRLKKAPLEFFASSSKSNFKFVIGSPEDLDEVHQIVYRFKIPEEKVILMPLGTTVESLDKREKWLAELCRERGYAFSDRMHIRLFGNQRGV